MDYTDIAIKPVQAEEWDELELFTVDESARRVVKKIRIRMAGQA